MDETKPPLLPPGDSPADDVKHTRRKDKRYNRTPRTPEGRIDKKKIKELYMASPILGWRDFCVSKNWNPMDQNLQHTKWEQEKREIQLWEGLRSDMEQRSVRLEADTLNRALKTMQNIPEGLLRLWDVLNYQLSLDQMDIAHDLQIRAAHRNTGSQYPVPIESLHFIRSAQHVWALSQTAKTISESLYKALGLQNATMGTATELRKRLEDKYTQVTEAEDAEVMNIELMGTGDIEARLKDAFEKYMDKPGQAEIVGGGNAEGSIDAGTTETN